MKETQIKHLEPRLQKHIEKATKVIDKDPSYAADILFNIVKANPNCVEVRRLLRKAQNKSGKPKGGGLGGLFAKLPFGGGVNESSVRKNPEKALQDQKTKSKRTLLMSPHTSF